jgi:hypothetical protein
VELGIAAFVTDEGIGAAALAAAVEERGLHSLVVTEHSHIPVTHATVSGRRPVASCLRLAAAANASLATGRPAAVDATVVAA